MADTVTLIIAGSRTIDDFDLVEREAFKFCPKIDVLLCGMAPGIDTNGYQLAKKYNIPIWEYPADWTNFGKVAGPIRNALMAKRATHCLVIWDGKSKGSASMIKEAKKHNLFLKVIEL